MKKALLTTAVMIVVTLFLFNKFFYDEGLSRAQTPHTWEAKTETFPTSQDIARNTKDIDERKQEFNPAQNWCEEQSLFDVQERVNISNQLNEWAIQRGEITLPILNSSFENPNAELIAPYIEAPLEDVAFHAKEGNEFALLVLMQRRDTPLPLRLKSAKSLVVSGHTSIALAYLVSMELAAANQKYEQREKLDEEVKNHVLRSLVYVSYGIDKLDASGLRAYLTFVKNSEGQSKRLNPEIALSDSEITKVYELKSQFIHSIDMEREKRNLPPVGQSEFPDVALRSFETSLAVEYYNFGVLIEGSRNLKGIGHSFTDKSECLEKLVNEKLYN